MKRLIFPLVLGFVGGGILIALGLWQIQRMQWKEGILAEIEARIHAPAVAVPASPDPEADRYLPVKAEGKFTGAHVDVLVSRKEIGAGVRVIEAFETLEGRRLLVDRGFIAEAARALPREEGAPEVEGNLHWPQEVDSFTPKPDAKTGLWFARDLDAMAAALNTEPVLIVARHPTAEGIEPMAVDASGIPNDHMGYAIQWFGLALVWFGMTAYLVWRIKRRTL